MPCDCPNIECIEVYVSACDTGVDTGIVVDADGNYFVRLKFNHAFKTYTFALDNGDTLILPNDVNGNYVHELQVYKPDGALLNDTCYALDVRTIINSGNGLTPSPSVDPYSLLVTLTSDMVAIDGLSITNSLFGGHAINEINTENQTYLVGVAFSQSGNTITAITISFYVGQIIKVNW